jgi:RNA polymerase sigma-70 factor (ECF subfamily)
MESYENFSDEELVEQIRKSDRELYAIIIKRYQEKLLRYANNLIKDESRASDAVQESFIKAFINLNSFNTKKKFSSWIYRIVHNETLNIIKKYKLETPLLEDLDFVGEENIEEDFDKNETNNPLINLSKTREVYFVIN